MEGKDPSERPTNDTEAVDQIAAIVTSPDYDEGEEGLSIYDAYWRIVEIVSYVRDTRKSV